MKGIKVILLVFIIIAGRAGQAQNYYEKGLKEYYGENGSMTVAIGFFSLAIKNKQEVARAYMMRGIAKGISGDFENGVADLNASARLDSTDYKLYFYYGKIYLLHGDYVTAVQYYDIAVAKNPTDPKNYDDRAVAKGYLKRFDEAIKDEDRAISLDHGSNIFYVNRGFMKAGKQEYAAAIADYTTSIKIKPSHNAFADRGFAFYLVKQYQKAIDDFTEALAINPADYDIYYRRGVAYKAIANMDKACFDFKRSAALGYPPAKEELTKINCN